jgi:hypothetical protein
MGWVLIPSGPCGANATCYLKSSIGAPIVNDCRISGFSPAGGALLPPAFSTLPLGALAPAGWLAAELTVAATGLTGFLADFWEDISNSSYIGGKGDGGLHERAPYWLNGLVPLSYLLPGDSNIGGQRDRYLQYIMANQDASGWLGLDDMPKDGNQYWSRFNVILALEQYYEASGDSKAITAIFRYLGEARRRMLGDTQLAGWAVSRAQDFIWGLQWLMDNLATLSGVPPGYNEAFLLDLMDITRAQCAADGGDWKTFFDVKGEMPEGPACTGGARCDMYTHGVNIGQAIKSEAVWYRRSADLTDAASTYIRMEKLDTFHGVPSGMFQADEHLAGKVPSHGTETCAVVEAVVSYAVSAAILGDPVLFERAERIAFNALPAATTKDQWERVYLQSSNQFVAAHQDPFPWYTDGADSSAFSLEGNYGCCTANMHAGWPKFAQRAVGMPAAGGVAVLQWLPSTSMTPNATITITTDYPFGDTATVLVTPTAAAGGAPVPVLLRIPSWAGAGTLSVNGGAATPLAGSNGTFLSLLASGTSTSFALDFAPAIRLESYANGSVAVLRGALLYSLWVGQSITVTAVHPYSSKDLAVNNTAPWNVALDLSQPLTFSRTSPPSSVPFNSTFVPVTIAASGRVVAGWGTERGAPAAPPVSPACAAPDACAAAAPITLVPFGSTHVRMAVLPVA